MREITWTFWGFLVWHIEMTSTCSAREAVAFEVSKILTPLYFIILVRASGEESASPGCTLTVLSSFVAWLLVSQ